MADPRWKRYCGGFRCQLCGKVRNTLRSMMRHLKNAKGRGLHLAGAKHG
jgi:hypothetical protein